MQRLKLLKKYKLQLLPCALFVSHFPFKAKFTIMQKRMGHLVFLLCCLSISTQFSASGVLKHNEPKKAKAGVSPTSQLIPVDSIPNYSISVNGNENTVKINSTLKDDKSTTKEIKGINKVTVNGEGNLIKIDEGNKRKVTVNQNGNNNSVIITQSTQQP